MRIGLGFFEQQDQLALHALQNSQHVAALAGLDIPCVPRDYGNQGFDSLSVSQGDGWGAPQYAPPAAAPHDGWGPSQYAPPAAAPHEGWGPPQYAPPRHIYHADASLVDTPHHTLGRNHRADTPQHALGHNHRADTPHDDLGRNHRYATRSAKRSALPRLEPDSTAAGNAALQAHNLPETNYSRFVENYVKQSLSSNYLAVREVARNVKTFERHTFLRDEGSEEGSEEGSYLERTISVFERRVG
jgi:hypothetical protein